MSIYKNIDISFDDVHLGKIIETIYEFLYKGDENTIKSKNDKELENEKDNNGNPYVEDKKINNKHIGDKKSTKEVNEIKDEKEKEEAGDIKEFLNYKDTKNDKETKNNIDNKDNIKDENAPIQVCSHKILGIVTCSKENDRF